MQITDLLLTELDHEAIGIRKALEHIPEGKKDWKPHEKSMPLGALATIVATIPTWLDMVVNVDELDIRHSCQKHRGKMARGAVPGRPVS